MARRSKGRRGNFRRARRGVIQQTTDSFFGVATPTSGITDFDVPLSAGDYFPASTITNTSVRVHRIQVNERWSLATRDSTFASFLVEFALIAATPDQRAAFVTAGVSLNEARFLGMRTIRYQMRMYEESTGSAQNSTTPPPAFTCNLKTNFVLKDPQSLYMVRRPLLTQGIMDSYEHSYTSCVWWSYIL